MTQPILSLICALGSDRSIGRRGELPWRIPDDLKRFKRLTWGHPILMGRKTFESIGRALPGRRNIVLTRNPSFEAAGCLVSPSLEAALALASAADCPDREEVFIIGGADLYRQTLALADRLYLTRVDAVTADADAFFPEYEGFRVVFEERHPGHVPPFRWVDLVRGPVSGSAA